MSKRTFEEFFSTHDSIEIQRDTMTPIYRRPIPPPPPIPKEILTSIPDMDYESPIKILQDETRTQIDDGIYKVVRSYGVDVDKDELIKALKYDRQQYIKGFRDGVKKFAEILREELIQCDRVLEGYGSYITRKGYDMEDIDNAVDNIESELVGDT